MGEEQQNPEQPTQDQAEQLVGALLPYAEQMLSEHGEFLPYAGVITSEGQLEMVQFATKDEAEVPLSAQRIHDGAAEMLRDGAQTGKFTTTALVSNVTVVQEDESKVDAVGVSLDDNHGRSLVIFFPYTIDAGKVGFGTAFARMGSHAIFGAVQ